MLETNFTEPANVELARQIEELAPDIGELRAQGFGPDFAKCLVAAIRTGQPDIGELRANGVAAASAVAICQTISDRHVRVAAALARMDELKAKPRAAAPAPVPDELDGMTATSMLHTLFQQAESPSKACITELMNDGWSASIARELAKVINATRSQQRGIAVGA